MIAQNLLKPPRIQDDAESHQSEAYTNKSYNRPALPKNKRKENTLRIAPTSQQFIQIPKDHDNQSVHSNASGRSKGKKSKESSLGRAKIVNSPIQNKDDDVQSVNSTGSRHSHKSTKKQNTIIIQKPKLQGPVRIKQESSSYNTEAQNKPTFKEAWKYQEESVIKPYSPIEKTSPIQNLGRPQPIKNERTQNQQKIQAKFSPFAEIQQQQYNSDDEPVIQLIQPAEYNKKNVGILGTKKNDQKQKVVVESRLMFDESNTVFGESKLRQTKSRRRNIFQKSGINQNSSKVSNSIAESSVSGLGDNSRRKSTSRRREIFNSSRQKQADQKGKNIIESQSNLVSIGPLPFQSKDIGSTYFKQAPGQNDRFKPLEKKVLGNDNDDFGLDESKSDLNLSASNHVGKDRDSLIFQFEPQKKKGMTIVSTKNVRNSQGSRQKQQNMLNLKQNNLTSVGKESDRQMIKVNNNLVSKELQDVQKILSSNEQYLNKIQHVGSIDSYKPNKQNLVPDRNTNNCLNYNTGESQKPWHQIVNNYQEQEVINIKTVQRNEKKINKGTEQKYKQELVQRQKQKELQIQKQRQLDEIQKQKQIQIKKRRQQQQRQLQILRKQQQERRQIELKKNQQRQENERKLAQQKKEEERKLKQKLENEKKLKEQQILRQRQLIRQKDEEILKLKQLQKQKMIRQKQEFQKLQKLKQRQLEDQHVPKLTNVVSSFSREQSENNSEKSSKSNKKSNKKKQSSLVRDKNHKVYVKNQSPRGQESFYQSNEEPSEQEPFEHIKLDNEQKQDKKPKLLSFSDEQQDCKPKSRTDNNFYDFNHSQKSIKPPSSKPPLSKRSNGSGGSLSKQKKPKQKTIAIKIKDQPLKKVPPNNSKQQQKKMSLMERAMMKHKQQSSNGSCSQDSFRNRQSYDSQNSRKSNSSRNSRGSMKKESTLNIKVKDSNMIYSKYGKAPLGRQSSNSSSHEEQMERIQKERQSHLQMNSQKERQQLRLQSNRIKQNIINERVIVSKNCTFIDERGRLVNKDLVIKGKQVYGIPSTNQNVDSSVLDRMKRSRDERRSRSKSRDKNKLSKKFSRDGSQAESNNQSSSYGGQSYYQNNSRGFNGNNSRSNYGNIDYYNNNQNTLREFIKPIEQVPMYQKVANKIEKTNFIQPNQPKTLNDMFSRKNSNMLNSNASMNQSRSRKSLGRTEKTFNKK